MMINNRQISDKLVSNYIKHFREDKADIYEWERVRKKLHDAIFESIEINRFNTDGQKFSDALDKHCIPFIEKDDYFVAGLKKICTAKSEMERQQATLDLENRRMFEELQKRKKGLPSVYSEMNCRVCGKDLVDGVPRVNDHLMQDGLDADPVDRAICMKCADDKPDEHFKEFRAKHWSH